MWSETSRGYLCIQVWGQTKLIGSGADSVPRRCLCVYPRRTRIWGFFFFFIRVLSLSTWFAVLPVPRVICWTCVNLIYFRQHSDAIRIQFLEGARGTLQEMMRSNHENRIPENTSSSSFPQNILWFWFHRSRPSVWASASPARYGTRAVFPWQWWALAVFD